MIGYWYHSKLTENLVADMKRLASHKVKQYLSRPDGELDLHGLTVREALEETARFLEHAERQHWQKVRIITGRGLNSPAGKAVLKEAIGKWLLDYGYRYRSATGQEGGPGSLIVSL